MRREELKGRVERLRGKGKQAVGDLTDNESLRGEGLVDEATGRVREGVGRTRRRVGKAIERIRRDVNR